MDISSYRHRDYLDLFHRVAKQRELYVSAKHSLWGGMAVGAISTVGAFLMGPRGLAIGGAVGGLLMACNMRDKLVPVGDILRDMSDREWQSLIGTLKELSTKGAMDGAKLVASGTAIVDVMALAVTALGLFLSVEKNLNLEQPGKDSVSY